MVREASHRGTIIVIDDSAVVQRVLQKRLEAHGFRVVTLDSPVTIARAVEEHHPDVVLMDLEMPGLDGDQAARTLLDTIADPPPIVIHSSLGQVEMDARAHACGAVGAIGKTTDDLKFLTQLDALIARTR